MEQKLKDYVYSCFTDAPKTARALEIREEICANVLERYRDLLQSGATPEEAYEIARRSVGNVGEILDGLEEEPQQLMINTQNLKKRAAFIGFGVALYILAPALLVLTSYGNNPVLGVFLLLACAAAATGLVIYGAQVYPKNVSVSARGMSNEEAEDFQQWRAEKISGEKRKRQYNGILWPIIVAVYFIVSFATGAWYITWIIFCIGAAIEKLLEVASS